MFREDIATAAAEEGMVSIKAGVANPGGGAPTDLASSCDMVVLCTFVIDGSK